MVVVELLEDVTELGFSVEVAAGAVVEGEEDAGTPVVTAIAAVVPVVNLVPVVPVVTITPVVPVVPGQ